VQPASRLISMMQARVRDNSFFIFIFFVA